jgi:hypothetical protein
MEAMEAEPDSPPLRKAAFRRNVSKSITDNSGPRCTLPSQISSAKIRVIRNQR